jgi:hypothetical protein
MYKNSHTKLGPSPPFLQSQHQQLLWIRIGFNADPDPACHLIAVPDLDKTLKSQKVEFLHEKMCLK